MPNHLHLILVPASAEAPGGITVTLYLNYGDALLLEIGLDPELETLLIG